MHSAGCGAASAAARAPRWASPAFAVLMLCAHLLLAAQQQSALPPPVRGAAALLLGGAEA